MDQQFLLGMFTVTFAVVVTAVIYLIDQIIKANKRFTYTRNDSEALWKYIYDFESRVYQYTEASNLKLYGDIDQIQREIQRKMEDMERDCLMQNDQLKSTVTECELINASLESLREEVATCIDSHDDLDDRISSLEDDVFNIQHAEEIVNTKVVING